MTHEESRPTNDAAATSASTREKTRDRVRRHRAARKQVAAIQFVRTDAGMLLHPDWLRAPRTLTVLRRGYEVPDDLR